MIRRAGRRRLPSEVTFSWRFLILNALKVPFYVGLDMITLETLRFNLLVAPLIVFGV